LECTICGKAKEAHSGGVPSQELGSELLSDPVELRIGLLVKDMVAESRHSAIIEDEGS